MTRLFLICFFLASILHAEDVQGLVIPFKQATVISPVLQDIIAEINVEEGDEVKQKQPIARLISEKEDLEVQQYAKLIERKQFEANGMQSLLKDKVVSKDAAMEKQTDLELARIQHKLALVRLNEKTIRAPLDGLVVKKYKEVGEGVDRAEKLFDIVNIDQVYAQFYIDPKLRQTVRTGMKVPVHFAGTKTVRDYIATVSFVDPRLDAASGLVRVKLLLDNPDRELKVGMRSLADFAALKPDA